MHVIEKRGKKTVGGQEQVGGEREIRGRAVAEGGR